MSEYTAEMIKRIDDLRTEGLSWAEVALEFKQVYGTDKTGNALQKAYKIYFQADSEAESEALASSHATVIRARQAASRERKIAKAMAVQAITYQAIMDGIVAAVKGIREYKPKALKDFPKKKIGGIPMTVELLFSDLQIGKLMVNYNTPIAIKRMEAYTDAALFKINQHMKSGYRIERLIFAMIGDIIESDKKHDNSGRATDSGTASQIKDAIEGIYTRVIEPLATFCDQWNIQMEVIAVTGNHDQDSHGLLMFDPGKEHLSWPLYHSLRMICAAADLPVKFTIPEGCFAVTEIYGHGVLYEHGVGTKANEADMLRRIAQRGRQTKKHLTYMRVGDKHHISRFNEDTLVINGAFFGDDREGREYSGIVGYSSMPGQIAFFYVPRDNDNRLPLYDSFVIQLGHIK